MSYAFPKQVELEAHEVWRINRIILAQHFHKLPHEIDAAPYEDMVEALEIIRAQKKIEEFDINKARAKK